MTSKPFAEGHDPAKLSAALAQPEPKAPALTPTFMEIVDLADQVEADGLGLVDLVRHALARWGRPTIQPVAVAERPWEREGWCDAEGRCWWFNHAGIPEWQLASDGPYGDFSLPHHALPLPAQPTTNQ